MTRHTRNRQIELLKGVDYRDPFTLPLDYITAIYKRSGILDLTFKWVRFDRVNSTCNWVEFAGVNSKFGISCKKIKYIKKYK